MLYAPLDDASLIEDYKWVVSQILDSMWVTMHDRVETLQALKDLREFEDRIFELEKK